MTTAVSIVDGAARTAIAEALDETLVVEAAAGTGKTTALVGRMLAVLAQGRARIGELVAVTFTEKAAGELKLRLRESLENGRADTSLDADARSRLEDALGHLEEGSIGTIHAFCADLLRERPIEAGIDPLFSVLTEGQAKRLFDEAFGAWLERTLEQMPEGLRRALRRTSRPEAGGEPRLDGPVDRIRGAGWELAEWRDHDATWARPPFDRPGHMAAVETRLREVALATARPAYARDPLYLDTAPARRAAAEIELLHESEDEDGIESLLVDLARDWNFRRARKGSGQAFASGVARADVFAAYQALVNDLDAFRVEADADLAAALRDDLRGCVAEYEALKATTGALDFLDLLVRARNLVRDDASARRDFQARFARLFVDEFQDTDPLQAELLLLLAADDPDERDWTRVRPRVGCLFLVGDPKQSIYRFRRANVGVYQQVVAQVLRQGGRRVELSTSFRATPNLQRAVNLAFGFAMHEDADIQQAGYIPLAPCRDPLPGQPSLVALPVPRPYGVRRIAKASIESSLPDAVGAFVDWLVHHSGWTVTGRDGAARAIQPGDVCILFRRFVSYGSDVTRPYLDALEARGVPHVLVGGRAFHDREEIETLRAALTAIEWPDDELSVFATLRGALFAVGDEALLDFRHRFPRGLHPLKRASRAARGAGTNRRRPDAPRQSAPGPEPQARGRHRDPPARRHAGARRLRAAPQWRTGAGQRAPRRRARAPVRTERRPVVPRVRGGPARGGRNRRRAGRANRRGRRGRRTRDDGAQGQGTRVPGRHPGRHHGEDRAGRSVPVHRQRNRAMCAAARRLVTVGPRPQSGHRAGEGCRGRRPSGVRGRDAGPRRAGRAGGRGRAARRRVGQPPQSRPLSGTGRAPAGSARGRLSDLRARLGPGPARRRAR